MSHTFPWCLMSLKKNIKRDLYTLRDMNFIKYVGSNKTGHWEAIV